MPALTAIHLTHRIGAMLVGAYLFWLAWRLLQMRETRRLGIVLCGALALQIVLGVSNVWFGLPLAVAVSHNGVAAVLVGVLVVLNFKAFQARLQY